jgi:hypothetical protein
MPLKLYSVDGGDEVKTSITGWSSHATFDLSSYLEANGSDCYRRHPRLSLLTHDPAGKP